MHPILTRAKALSPKTTGWRRDFHAHPELGFHEDRTSGIVAQELERLGYQVRRGVGKTGVVGVMDGHLPGACVMLRFDMDALPIPEETGLTFASENSGVMHACGHDGHTAIGLTVATLISEMKDKFSGTVKLVFQPAEEGLGGASAMIRDGVLNSPTPQAALGLHIWSEYPVGWAAVTTGAFMAGAEMFRITITGKGGHGALPQNTVDPVLASAQVITALQSIVARNVSPLNAAVVSVTQINGGSTFNIIPAEVVLGGTVRTYTHEMKEHVWVRIHEIVEGISSAMGCKAAIEVLESDPAVINSDWVTATVIDTLASVTPEVRIAVGYKSSVSEDMALFLERIPGCFFFLGAGLNDPARRFGHHHPKFDIDEEALPLGAAILTQGALELLNRLGQ